MKIFKKFRFYAILTISMVAVVLCSVSCEKYITKIGGKAAKVIRSSHKPDAKFDRIYGYGIDLSHHNAEPSWDKLDVDFVILKASEGSSYIDPTFSQRAKMSKDKGFSTGAYHFFSGTGNADKEFNNFYCQVKGKIDIIPVIDIEKKPKGVSKKDFQKRFLRFMDRTKEEFGVYPIIYTSEGFYFSYLKKIVDNKLKKENESPILWFGDVTQPYRKYNLTPHIHQAKIKNVKGVRGKIDFNELHCNIEEILLKAT